MKIFFLILLIFLSVFSPGALDLWQYPEMADRNSIFAGVFVTSFSTVYDNYFKIPDPEVHLDYVLPVGLPFSMGLSLRAFEYNYFSLGLRPGYHINLNNAVTDLYFLYTIDLVFRGDFIYLEYGGRIGLRRRLGRFLIFQAESGHGLRSLNLGLSFKIN